MMSDDDVCLRRPRTIEDLLDIMNLLPGMIQEVERRSEYLGEPSVARNECMLHLRKLALHLQREGVARYGAVSQLSLPEWRRPA